MAKNINFLGNVTERNQEIVSQYPIVNSTTAYKKDVPEGALPYAEVNRVGGMSYKTKNLLKPYAVGTSSWNGYAITRNADGSTTVTGAATEAREMLIDLVDVVNYPVYMGAGETYTLTVTKDGVPIDIGEKVEYKDAAGGTYWGWAGDTTRARALTKLYVQKTVSVGDNTTLNGVYRAILTKGNTVVPYEPYFDGLRDSKVTEVKSVGANLIPYPYYHTTRTENGLTFTVLPNGEITVNGTATANTNFYIRYTISHSLTLEIGETYTLSGCPSGGEYGKYGMRIEDNSFTKTYYDYGNGRTFTAEHEQYYLRIVIYSGMTMNNLTFKPMLNKGSTVLPFAPYTESALPIPTAVQALDGYGLGVSAEYCNYINWNPEDNIKTWNVTVKKKALDGSEGWSRNNYFTAGNGYTLQEAYLPDYKANTLQGVCSHFDTRNSSSTLASGAVFGSRFNIVTPADMGLTDSTLFKSYLAAQYAAGTPVTIVYAIATPEVTDISNLFIDSNMIDVQPNGSMTFVNEYGYDVPSTITCYNSAQYTIAGKLLGVAEKAIYDEDGEKLSKTRERVSATEKKIDAIDKKIDELQWACDGVAFDVITETSRWFSSPGYRNLSLEGLYGKYTTFSKIGNITGQVMSYHHFDDGGDNPGIGISHNSVFVDSALEIPEATQNIYLEHLLSDPTDINSDLNFCYIDLLEEVAVKHGEFVKNEHINFDDYTYDLNTTAEDYEDYSALIIHFNTKKDYSTIYGAYNPKNSCSIPSEIVIDQNEYRLVTYSLDCSKNEWQATFINNEHYSFSDIEVEPLVNWLKSNAIINYGICYDKYEDVGLITKTSVPVDFETTVILPDDWYDIGCSVGEMEYSYLKKKEV